MGYVIAAGADREIYAASAKEALRLYRMARRSFGSAKISDEAGRAVTVRDLTRDAEQEAMAKREQKREQPRTVATA